MAGRALSIVGGSSALEIHVRVVARSTSELRILGIVAPAVEQAIRLKPDIVDAPEIRHHRYRIYATMTGAAELLRKGFRIEYFRIKDVTACFWCDEPGRDMASSRSVAGLAGYPGNHVL